MAGSTQLRSTALLMLLTVALTGPTWAVEAQGAAEQGKFDINEFAIEGNTRLSDLDIERTVYPHLGPGRSIQDVDAAREELEKAFHDAGYLTVFVDIPEQKVDAGVVRLRVTEARVERLRVTGSRYFSLGEIKSRVPELAQNQVPNFPQMQKELASLNTTQDRRVTPVLRPGKTPGTVEVELKVDDQLPLHGSVEYNNRYNANSDHERVAASLHYDNLWQKDHSLALSFQAAPASPDQATVFYGAYTLPLSARGDSLTLYAVSSNSDVNSSGGFNFIGDGTVFGARYSRMLRGTPDYSHSLTVGFDIKDFNQGVRLIGADTVNTPIRYMPWMLQYGSVWANTESRDQFSLSANFAPRGLGNQDADFENRRFKAHASYFYLRGDWQHTHNLPGGTVLASHVSAQATGSPLISNEQYFIGGVDSVRGYMESERSGDYGVTASLEFRSPNWSIAGPEANLYVLGFIEGGAVRNLDPLPGETWHSVLSSAGVGMRMKPAKQVTASVDLAAPFKPDSRGRKESRAHFRLAYEF